MDWSIDPTSKIPPSRQIVEVVLDAVASGELAVGGQLPSVRGLAGLALVNHNTVARAYRDLEQLGVTEARSGLGVYVAAAGPNIARAERRAATLSRFREAAGAAIRAGHSPVALQRLLTDLITRKTA